MSNRPNWQISHLGKNVSALKGGQMDDNRAWKKTYFTDRSGEGLVSPNGIVTMKGLLIVLLDLCLEGNYHPICKKDLTLYSNSARGVSGRYYELTQKDEDVLSGAISLGLLEYHEKAQLEGYLGFTEAGLQQALRTGVPSPLASILGETDDTLLKAASRDGNAVCELMLRFETDLIRARSFDASDFTYHPVVNILHKMMLDPKTATEHLTRKQNRKVRQKPIENDCSLFDLYIGQKARVVNSFEQGMFMSVRQDDSEYRLGKWDGGYNHLGDYNPLNYGRRSLTRAEWLGTKIFEVYSEEYTVGQLVSVLRNDEVSHSSLSKREALKRMMEIANRNLRGDGDVGQDDARGVHETLVYLGYHVGMLLRIIRCWRATL